MKKTIVISIAIIIVGALSAGGYLYWKHRKAGATQANQAKNLGPQEENIVVTKSQENNGRLDAPQGLPSEIPLESANITESIVVDYPNQNARQYTVSYTSTSTLASKYSQYKNFMASAGYKFTEAPTNSPAKAIFGSKGSINLSVAVSSNSGKTVVQISYLSTLLK